MAFIRRYDRSSLYYGDEAIGYVDPESEVITFGEDQTFFGEEDTSDSNALNAGGCECVERAAGRTAMLDGLMGAYSGLKQASETERRPRRRARH